MKEHRMQRRTLLAGAAAAGLAMASGGSRAQSAWPNKPVSLVVPFPAGGGTDAFARPLAAQFAKVTGKMLVIDNRGGRHRGRQLRGQGCTRRLHPVHGCRAPCHRAIHVSPARLRHRERLHPPGAAGQCAAGAGGNPKAVPASNFKQFLEHVKRNPARLNYGSAGAGTSHHLAGELFKQQTGTFITHIPYRGAGPALQDLIAGNVDMMFDGMGSSATHIKSGRIKALMVSGSQRNPAFPDVPCAAEVGLPDYTVTTWYGLWAPKGTPADVQARIIEDIRRIGAADEIKAIWAGNGAEYGGMTQAQFAKFVSTEVRRWAQVVKGAGAKLG